MPENNMITEFKEIRKKLHLAMSTADLIAAAASIPIPFLHDDGVIVRLAESLESLALTTRNFAEKHSTQSRPNITKRACAVCDATGFAEITEYGWLHLHLNMLLPHCRYDSTAFLTSIIIRLLDTYEVSGHRIPKFQDAFLVIDEHCDIENRQVFDVDNRGWKAIPNALKGRVFEDDDQFSLHMALISTVSSKPECHIYVLDQRDAECFFGLRYGGYALN